MVLPILYVQKKLPDLLEEVDECLEQEEKRRRIVERELQATRKEVRMIGMHRNRRDLVPRVDWVEEVAITDRQGYECTSGGQIKDQDPYMRIEALNKAVYLRLSGCETRWLPFHVVEMMSFSAYGLKCVAYKAAAECLAEDEQAALMATNQLKKDLASPSVGVRMLVLELLASLSSTSLLCEMSRDVLLSLKCTNHILLKRAAPIIWRVFQLDESYRDEVMEVISEICRLNKEAVIHVAALLPEMATIDPIRMLPFVPCMYTCFNDPDTPSWIRIKLLKAFMACSVHESRLPKKLAPSLRSLITDCTPIPLLQECIVAAQTMLPNDQDLAATCWEQMDSFFARKDPNLVYLGLRNVSSLIRHDRVHKLSDFDRRALECLNMEDHTIRRWALTIIEQLANPSSIKSTTEILLYHLGRISLSASDEDALFRESLISTIMSYCRRDCYSNVEDFSWYIETLSKLARIPTQQHGYQLANDVLALCFMDKETHPLLLRYFRPLLDHLILLESNMDGPLKILKTSAWLVGEYCSLLDDYEGPILSMLQPAALNLTEDVLISYMTSIQKILLTWNRQGGAKAEEKNLDLIQHRLHFVCDKCKSVELYQRRSEVMNLLNLIRLGETSEAKCSPDILDSLFHEIAQPLHKGDAAAQKRIAREMRQQHATTYQNASQIASNYKALRSSVCVEECLASRAQRDTSFQNDQRTITQRNEGNIPDEKERCARSWHEDHVHKNSLYYLGSDSMGSLNHAQVFAMCMPDSREDPNPLESLLPVNAAAVGGPMGQESGNLVQRDAPDALPQPSRRKPSREVVIKDV